MSDQKLIDECAALVPGEQIVAAGAFQPRGTQLAMSAGILGIIASRVMAQNAHLPRYAAAAAV